MSTMRSIIRTLLLLIAAFSIQETLARDSGSCPSGFPRVVSLSPDSTEILAEFIPPACFIGVDANSNYPSEIAAVPRIGDFYSVNLEYLHSLDFDIISAGNSFNGIFLEKLKKSYPDILILKLDTLNSVLSSIENAGMRLGMENRAQSRSEELRKIIQDTEARFRNSSRIRVLPVIWQKPLIAAAAGTYINELMSLCGAENIITGTPVKYPEVGIEDLIAGNADIVINFAGAGMHIPPGLNIKEYTFPDQDLVMRSTPRSITEGLTELCRIIETARTEKENKISRPRESGR
ncbi:helical backbone metal receptor [Succinimonas amylolytica]|uniref:helical backbone metal receptor n=1 Tax=Succinimonas amylolytica TaxID=83769 RepID=UPI00039EBD81|nr:helical backbone metal receptor [Succinimonas amylolytica]